MKKWKLVSLALIFVWFIALVFRVLSSHAEYVITPPPQPQTATSTPKLVRGDVPKAARLPVVTEENLEDVVSFLIKCESGGRRGTKVLDVNQKYSIGELQFQQDTWNHLSERSGITGTPESRQDSIKMAKWALLNGEIWRWRNCALKYAQNS